MDEKIHGHTILAHASVQKGRIILVDRGGYGHGRFVTGLQGISSAGPDSEWAWGHYFNDIHEARDDFHARARRGY